MGTANGPEQRQLRPEPAGQPQPCQHSNVGVEIRNVQGRGRGRKITPNLAPARPSWSQQSCPIKTDLVPKGICVHLLSKERVGQEPQQIPLHLWFGDTLSNPEKLMSKGKPALPPNTLLSVLRLGQGLISNRVGLRGQATDFTSREKERCLQKGEEAEESRWASRTCRIPPTPE